MEAGKRGHLLPTSSMYAAGPLCLLYQPTDCPLAWAASPLPTTAIAFQGWRMHKRNSEWPLFLSDSTFRFHLERKLKYLTSVVHPSLLAKQTKKKTDPNCESHNLCRWKIIQWPLTFISFMFPFMCQSHILMPTTVFLPVLYRLWPDSEVMLKQRGIFCVFIFFFLNTLYVKVNVNVNVNFFFSVFFFLAGWEVVQFLTGKAQAQGT